MILTCPECRERYKLNATMLGVTGREVRCIGCGHTWFQLPDIVLPEQQKEAEGFVAPPEPAQSIKEALDSILEKDDAAFEAILSDVSNAKASVSRSSSSGSSAAAAVEREEKRPKARQESALPVVTHNPLGIGAAMFGGLVFLLCVFLTLAVIFIGQKPILRHWPQMALLYKTIGFDVRAPGEGLRISEMIAEQRIDSKSKALVVEGKMTNMTGHAIAYPALHVVLKNGRDKAMKVWDLKPGATEIASGDVVPVKLQLDDAPEDGSTIEVRVKGE